MTGFTWTTGRHLSLMLYFAGALLSMCLVAAALTGNLSIVITVLALATLILVITRSKAQAALVTLTYLFLMGDIRRIRDLVASHPDLDPLILLSPLFAGLVGIPLILHAKPRDMVSKGMLFLTLLMALEIYNPLQGGIGIGVGGALFFLVPMLWFWIGRDIGTPAVAERLIYHVLLPLSLAAAALGLYQNFVGFLPHEQAYIDAHYHLLNLAGHVRSFGFSNAPSEYMTLLMMGVAAAGAAVIAGRRAWILALVPLVLAILYASGRGAVIRSAFAISLAWVCRKGARFSLPVLIRIVVVYAIGLVLVSFAAARLVPSETSVRTASGAALAHQAEGLANPLDQKKSTAGIHAFYIAQGLRAGITNPIGSGLGATTAAVSKLGVAAEQGTEVDVSDLFIDLGAIGGLLYLGIVVLVMQESIAYTAYVPRATSLPVLAVLGCGLGSWLTVSQYATAACWMFLVGCVACKSHSKNAQPPVWLFPFRNRFPDRVVTVESGLARVKSDD